ncbi:MAG: KEOPS complex subunit Cgi121 [Candidatus Bathyarchaeia archaeon]
MLKKIEEFRVHVAITGFRNVKIGDVEHFLEALNSKKPKDVEIQFFNAAYVATWQHLYFAVINALTAFRNNENISKNLAMETLLFASAQRQIRKATGILGITPHVKDMAVLVVGERIDSVKLAVSDLAKKIKGEQDEKVLELTEGKICKIRELFGFSDEQLNASSADLHDALVNLVIEQMALLSTER